MYHQVRYVRKHEAAALVGLGLLLIFVHLFRSRDAKLHLDILGEGDGSVYASTSLNEIKK